MLLRDFLKSSEISPIVLAKTIGVSVQTVYRYLDGSRSPRRTVICKITEISGGKVTANDFVAQQIGAHGGAQFGSPVGSIGSESSS